MVNIVLFVCNLCNTDEKLHKLESEQHELEKVIHSIAKRNGLRETLSPPSSPKAFASPDQNNDSPPAPASSPLVQAPSSLPLDSEYPESQKGHASRRKACLCCELRAHLTFSLSLGGVVQTEW